MSSTFVLVVCFAGVFCLAPLSAYCAWIAAVNRRDRPTVIAGQWDFAALLLGLSGFVFFGGGLVLSLLQSNVRFLIRGNFDALRAAWAQERTTWCLLVGGYLLLVVGGVVLTLLARRRTLVVYNIEPAEFESTLTEVFDQLVMPVERRGNLWVSGTPVFELEPFAGGRTVTLRWLSDDVQLFQEVERHVRAVTPALSTDTNPAARWFVSAAAGAGALVFICAILLVVYSFALIR